MRLGHYIYLEQQQKLLMTPELRQAIAILQMSTMELAEHIRKELEENPFLEEKEHEESDSEPKEEHPDLSKLEEWLEYYNDRDIGFSVQDTEEEKSFENFITRTPSLYDHLEFQLRLTTCDREQLKIGLYLIGNIDENGYLCIDLEEVAQEFNVDVERVEGVLEIIQSFTPYGVATRNLAECLLLQLKHYGQDSELARKIIENHLEDLGKNRLNKIANELSVSVQEVQEVVDLIRTLDPKPGLQYGNDEVKYITPDVIVEKIDGKYVVLVNDLPFPRLLINRSYEKFLKQSDTNEDIKKYMEEKIGSAMWLLRSIEQRRMTLYKVASCIVEIQKDFLDKGVKYLKPLNLKQVAEMLNIHESTVSRATTNKYIQTPQGLYELKYFFSTGVGAYDKDKVSSKSIKHLIEEIIANEDVTKPLSDDAIAAILKEKGIKISRRTVAKYRQELGIGSTISRKRY